MFEAHGDGDWLYMSGKNKDGPGLQFQVTLGIPEFVGFGDIVITGDHGEIANLDVRGLKKLDLTVVGTDADNRVLLTKEDDTFFGGGGRDVAKGRAGDDALYGGDGRDKFVGKSGDDTLVGENDQDLLKGNGGDDELFGGASDDILVGGAGNDFLSGGTGFNKLSGDAGDDRFDGYFGDDIAVFDGAMADYAISLVDNNYRIVDLREGSPDGTDFLAFVETLKFADGRISLDPLAPSELSAKASGDTLTVSGRALLPGSDQLVTIDLSSPMTAGQAWVGDNTVVPIFVEIENNSTGLTIVDASRVRRGGVSVKNATVANLSDQGDRYFGTETHDTAHGEDGNDTLFGNSGGDTLFGDDGDDLIYGEDESDSAVEAPLGDELHGGYGNDTLNGGAGDDTLHGDSDDDLLNGGRGDDLLYGVSGDNTLNGNQGDDRLNGGFHSDTLAGGAGDDVIDGYNGEDIAVYAGNAADYEVSIFEGNYQVVDTREGSPDGTDIIGNVETLRFADQDVAIDPSSSSLTGSKQGVTLFLTGETGRADTDQLVTVIMSRIHDGASVAWETLVVDNGLIPITVYRTLNSVPTTLDATGVTGGGVSVGRAEIAYLTDQGDLFDGFWGPRNALAYGHGGNDTLYGGTGSDTLWGGNGDDFIWSSSDDDLLHGEEGDDTVEGASGDDQIFGGDGADLLAGGTGDDKINGGSGDDIAVFEGARTDFAISWSDGVLVVDGGAGSDQGRDELRNVETLRFDDGDVAVTSLSASPHDGRPQLPDISLESGFLDLLIA